MRLVVVLLMALAAVAAGEPGCISTTCAACLASNPQCGWCEASKQCLQGSSRALFFPSVVHSSHAPLASAQARSPPRPCAPRRGSGINVQVRQTCSGGSFQRQKKKKVFFGADSCLSKLRRPVPPLLVAGRATTCATAAGARPLARVWKARAPPQAAQCARRGSLRPVPASL